MEKIIGQRGSGKSTKLIQYAYDNNIDAVVCINPQHHLILAKEIGIPYGAIKFITYEEFDRQSKSHNTYVIDDIEHYLTLKNVRGYTADKE